MPGVGLVHLASQTEEAVVAVSDYEELDAAMAASVEEAQHAAEAKCQAAAADGLVTAIINRKRIQMDSVRYNVMWCEGEAYMAWASLRRVPSMVPSRTFVVRMIRAISGLDTGVGMHSKWCDLGRL